MHPPLNESEPGWIAFSSEPVCFFESFIESILLGSFVGHAKTIVEASEVERRRE